MKHGLLQLNPIVGDLAGNAARIGEGVRRGFDPATVREVLRLVRVAELKRRQAAQGLKVTDRAFGTGWRMPIAR